MKSPKTLLGWSLCIMGVISFGALYALTYSFDFDSIYVLFPLVITFFMFTFGITLITLDSKNFAKASNLLLAIGIVVFTFAILFLSIGIEDAFDYFMIMVAFVSLTSVFSGAIIKIIISPKPYLISGLILALTAVEWITAGIIQPYVYDFLSLLFIFQALSAILAIPFATNTN